MLRSLQTASQIVAQMSDRSKRSCSPPLLSELLAARTATESPALELNQADRALLCEDYTLAIALYTEVASSSPSERAKLGFCLGMQGQDDAAEALLNESNVGDHPEAKALLAWVLGGNSGQRMRGLGDEPRMRSMAARRSRVEALLRSALLDDRPPRLAFNAFFSVLGIYHDDALSQASRARLIYPNWSWPHAIVAGKQRVLAHVDPHVLQDMMRTLSGARHEEVFHEAFVHAMRLEHWDDADLVIEELSRLVGRDEQPGDANLGSLAEMRAMVLLYRARAGQNDAYQKAIDCLASFQRAVPRVPGGRDATMTSRFELQIALETAQIDQLKCAATTLMDKAWDAHGHDGEGLDAWSPWISTPSLIGILRFGHFGFDFMSRWRDVQIRLSNEESKRWALIAAADSVLHGSPEPCQVELLCVTSTTEMPWWICRAIFDAHAHLASDSHQAGAVLAQLAERAADTKAAQSPDPPGFLDFLSVDVESLEQPLAVFGGALAWLRDNPIASGQALLEQWGSGLADVEGAESLLADLATLSLERADSEIARQMLELVQDADSLESRVARVLVRYPQPESTRVSPEELSLLEAATLIALLRACPLDHVNWTLTPLSASAQSFEPTNKFIGTLFGLLKKGVVAIDPSTPAGTVELTADGQLTAYLTHVVWRISSNTLALQRSIRDLPIEKWPHSWRDHAPVLARDLGVEELVTYLEYLVVNRDLPAPNMDEARSLFRVQLEQFAIAQCYYLAHKTMRETLDYQALYRPGRTQVATRIINLLRGNGERAIAQGWDTRFARIRQLPPSLLWEALNDVLTGWGSAAFEKPVTKLTLE